MKQRRKLLWLLLIIPVLAGFLAYARYSQVHTDELNRRLMKAIDIGDDAAVLNLLEQGADPNVRYGPSSKPSGWWKMLTALFAGKRSAVNGKGETALMVAAETNWPRVVNVLLSHGAYVNATTEQGTTALMFVAAHNSKDIVSSLLDHGANVDAKSTRGYSAVSLAYGTLLDDITDLTVIRLLLNRERPVNQGDRLHSEILNWAAYGGHKDLVTLLLAHGTDINARSGHNSTPLINASDAKNPEIIRFLLEYHPDLTLKDNKGKTALYHAKTAGFTEGVNLLENAGAKE
jgi:ankyrin repeat protein